ERGVPILHEREVGLRVHHHDADLDHDLEPTENKPRCARADRNASKDTPERHWLSNRIASYFRVLGGRGASRAGNFVGQTSALKTSRPDSRKQSAGIR